MSALLKTGLSVLEEHVLTPRGNDMYPGTWTDGHPSPIKNIPCLRNIWQLSFDMFPNSVDGGRLAHHTL
jgi:hypothetical protein